MAVSIRTLALALLVWPASAAADPIVITNGLVETHVGISAARITLEGENFFHSTAASFGSPLAPLCSPCAAGTLVTLNGTYSQGLPFGGTLTLDGVTYTNLHFLGGSGTFTTAQVALPATGSLALPFQFTGVLLAFSELEPFGEPVFSRTLVGSGTATAAFTRLQDLGEPLFELQSEGLLYRFEGTTAPVPEPGSMLLLGTGLAALAARRWHTSGRRARAAPARGRARGMSS